jgi:hypothetical protein
MLGFYKMRKLYLLHIPKTGGTSVDYAVSKYMRKNNLPYFPGDWSKTSLDINETMFINAHIGTYPMDNFFDVDVACVFRDPVDRTISNFLWIFKDILSNKPEYYVFNNILDCFKFYAFEDKNFIAHRNLQTRFVCNPINSEAFLGMYQENKDISPFPDKYGLELIWKDFFVENDRTNINFAKKQVDSFKIIGITENLLPFQLKVHKWFKDNYGIDFEEPTKNKLRTGQVGYKGVLYDTDLIKDMLTVDEIEKIRYNNSLDVDLYRYVKEKLT